MNIRYYVVLFNKQKGFRIVPFRLFLSAYFVYRTHLKYIRVLLLRVLLLIKK